MAGTGEQPTDLQFAWGFFDSRTAEQRLAEARRLFREKFGAEAIYCLCNDQTAAALGARDDVFVVIGLPFIREYELRLGAPGGAA